MCRVFFSLSFRPSSSSGRLTSVSVCLKVPSTGFFLFCCSIWLGVGTCRCVVTSRAVTQMSRSQAVGFAIRKTLITTVRTYPSACHSCLASSTPWTYHTLSPPPSHALYSLGWARVCAGVQMMKPTSTAQGERAVTREKQFPRFVPCT